jgi:hypothetical protein
MAAAAGQERMNMTTVIPAQPGFFWLTAFIMDQAENDFAVSVPVVAWRVGEDGGGADPVLPAIADGGWRPTGGPHSTDDRIWSALLLPDGQILEPILKAPAEPRFDNIDQWLAKVRSHLEWRASHPVTAPETARASQPVTSPEAANQRRRPWWRRLVG